MPNSTAANLSWALTRFVFGTSLALFHGFPKIFEGKLEGFTQTVASLGFPAPTFFAWAAALTELVGGILVAVGLLTRPMAGLAAFTMLVALHRHRVDPFIRMELALLYLVVMLMAVVMGGGRFSLDGLFNFNMPKKKTLF
jgi:putative oxidoreductase